MNEGRSTLDQIKTMAYTLFEKSLPFDGTIMEMLEAITPQGNVLNLVHTLDGIFVVFRVDTVGGTEVLGNVKLARVCIDCEDARGLQDPNYVFWNSLCSVSMLITGTRVLV